ncbi:MAG: DUF5320 domain-containing protein [Clostridiaceae bacterium]|nr:DUF5320 domain-containing protein [Clostridiaceae bacterium]
MPGRDGTGPTGTGPMTGRGSGLCTGVNTARYGAGFGIGLGPGLACRRGFVKRFGRCFAIGETGPKIQKELLRNQKSVLEKRLEFINKKLEEQ